MGTLVFERVEKINIWTTKKKNVLNQRFNIKQYCLHLSYCYRLGLPARGWSLGSFRQPRKDFKVNENQKSKWGLLMTHSKQGT